MRRSYPFGSPAPPPLQLAGPIRALLLLAALAAACSPLAASRAHLVADPETVFLPAALQGGSSTASLTLLNLGDSPLELLELTLTGTGFFAQGCDAPLLLEPHEACVLTVGYRWPPDQDPGTHAGRLTLASSDPKRPRLDLDLIAPGLTAWLVVSPDRVDFGPTPSGTTDTHKVHVVNVGRTTVYPLLEWAGPAPDFSAAICLLRPPAPPDCSSMTTMPPGSTAEIEVSYTPRGGDSDQAALQLSWSGGSRQIAVSGRQDLEPPH